jgi:hypothetical protein
MSPADRAAVLAAQFDDMPPHQPDTRGGVAGGELEDIPKFDVNGSPEALQADLAVAKDNVSVLDELLEADAPPDLLQDVLRRCRAMRSAVLKVIDTVTDESTLDKAVTVCFLPGCCEKRFGDHTIGDLSVCMHM